MHDLHSRQHVLGYTKDTTLAEKMGPGGGEGGGGGRSAGREGEGEAAR